MPIGTPHSDSGDRPLGPAGFTASETSATASALRVDVAIVGGGPAGLMAAEVLSAAGHGVALFDAMPTVGRKFLLAGKGGLNLTHAEPMPEFLARYGARRAEMEPLLAGFGPAALRAWAEGLGIDTFVGSSGRVFPDRMHAAPLLRAWLARLRAAGVQLHMRHRWIAWETGSPAGRLALRFARPGGELLVSCRAVVLALGGGSWAKLGSDGAWLPLLREAGAELAPLRPSNCGFDVTPAWSAHLRERFAGSALKNVALTHTLPGEPSQRLTGELLLTETGLEGGLAYALSASLRDAIEAHGRAVVHLDLLPGRDEPAVRAELQRPRGSTSLANHLRRRLALEGAKAVLLHETLPRDTFSDADALARAIKALPLVLAAPRPIDEAISTAGGVRFPSLTADLELRARPGIFCAGEMLDWEAPTGGYLLTACFASGRAAAVGAIVHLRR